MAIALTGSFSQPSSGDGATTATASHNNPADGNYILIAAAIDGNGTDTSSATYNSNAMDKLVVRLLSLDTNQHVILFGLKGQASGAHNAVVSDANGTQISFVIQSFSGVDQTTPTGNTDSKETAGDGFTTINTLAVTSASGRLVVDAIRCTNNNTPAQLTATGGNTKIAADDYSARIAGMSYKAGAASTTFAWNCVVGDYLGEVGVELLPASGGGAGGFMWLGS